MRNLAIILALLLTGCVSGKQQSTLNKNEADVINIVVTSSENNRISFQINNNSDSIISIHNPKNLHIERFESDSWRKVRILMAPCGAPIARPDENIQIPGFKNYTIYWDGKESWCGERTKEGIKETVKKNAKEGKYRLRVLYGINKKKKEIFYKEFILN